jgi:hypothetical protein
MFKYYSIEKNDDNEVEYIFGFNEFTTQPDDPSEVYVENLYCIYSFSKTVSPIAGEDWEGPVNDYEMFNYPGGVIKEIFEDSNEI